MSRSKIFQYIYVIAFLGILAFLPYAIIYAAVKIFNFFKEIKHQQTVRSPTRASSFGF